VLRELHISGLGVIDDLELELHPGLNVLTGETGAGKTLVTVGLALALGGRAAASLVRPGAKAARAQARLDATAEAVRLGWAEDGELLLGRQIAVDGRTTARIGGQLAPVSTLAQLGATLVEAHGQHQGLLLLAGGAQTEFLDRFAGPGQVALLRAVREASARLRDLRTELEAVDRGTRERERELDLLRYQIHEIEGAGPNPGERARLEAEEARLAHAERLMELAASAERALAGDEAAADALRATAAALRGTAELDPDAAELAARAVGLAEGAVELSRDVRSYGDGLQLDPDRLQEVRQRIAQLGDLQRKYGADEVEVLGFLERARGRATELQRASDSGARSMAAIEEIRTRLADLAERLTIGRREAAPRLAAAIVRELEALGMEGAGADISLVDLQEIGPSGAERAEFRFSGGPLQPLLPLAKVASGGELSRTMLACRSVLADLDDVPTLVFDEVDAGIGGEAATAVGRRLALLAERRQVIVVTHLPQIASFADRHVRVQKRRGTATVEVLDDPGRVAELSRMLSGLPRSASASVHAEELLAEARRARLRR
jgi:DNA repair protein RecN (Recombination protein N)